MVLAADGALGDAQQIGPDGRQPPLGRGERDGVVLVGRGRFRLLGESGEHLPVDLAVAGQRQAGLPVEGRGNHVGGQGGTQRLAQFLRVQTPAGVEGDQVLVLAPAVGDDHRTVPYAGHPQQGVLDLADLDAEAADLDLVVAAAEELQLAAGVPAPPVTPEVEPLTRPVRVLPVGLTGPLGIVDVPAADADTGERDQPRGAQRHQRQVLVHDVDVHVVDRTPQQNALGHRVHDLVVGVVRRLGQPIGVDQPDARLDREPALDQLPLQRLTGHRHTPEVRQFAGVLLQIRDDDLQIGGHELCHRRPAAHERVDEPLHVHDHVLPDQQRAPAHHQRGHQLPQRDVEALRGGLRHHRAFADSQVVDLGVEMVEEARVLAHRALRLAGGAGREVDVGQLTCVDPHSEIAFGVRFRVGRLDEQLLGPRHGFERPVEVLGAAGLGQDQPARRP